MNYCAKSEGFMTESNGEQYCIVQIAITTGCWFVVSVCNTMSFTASEFLRCIDI